MLTSISDGTNRIQDRKERAVEGKLKELKTVSEKCHRCPLTESRINFVFGEGNPAAGLMFVGEGPGYEEDRQGRPFIGRAGQLLTKIIEAMKMKREDVYITNIVKCHPMKDPLHPESRGNDRPPSPEEVALCFPILLEQIRVIRPKIICCLGASAARAMLHALMTEAWTVGRAEGVALDDDLVDRQHALLMAQAPDATASLRYDLVTGHQMELEALQGVVVRLGNEYNYETYSDLYGNNATPNWNPRQCAKGYTFHRLMYGPYRLKHPIIRKGWREWADAGFPDLTPENKTKFKFDSRGTDTFEKISWDEVNTYIAKGLTAIARRYNGEEGKKKLLEEGYPEEMLAPM